MKVRAKPPRGLGTGSARARRPGAAPAKEAAAACYKAEWRACAEETREADTDAEGCCGLHQLNLAKAER